jgi:hypothetical protein
MPLPVAAAALVALPFLGKAGGAVKGNDGAMIVAVLGGLWLINQTWQLGQDVVDKVDIRPETGEFFRGLFLPPEEDEYFPDQSGSPNPPSRDWWEGYAEEGFNESPIEVQDGVAPPTAPILEIAPEPSTATKAGRGVRYIAGLGWVDDATEVVSDSIAGSAREAPGDVIDFFRGNWRIFN